MHKERNALKSLLLFKFGNRNQFANVESVGKMRLCPDASDRNETKDLQKIFSHPQKLRRASRERGTGRGRLTLWETLL